MDASRVTRQGSSEKKRTTRRGLLFLSIPQLYFPEDRSDQSLSLEVTLLYPPWPSPPCPPLISIATAFTLSLFVILNLAPQPRLSSVSLRFVLVPIGGQSRSPRISNAPFAFDFTTWNHLLFLPSLIGRSWHSCGGPASSSNGVNATRKHASEG